MKKLWMFVLLIAALVIGGCTTPASTPVPPAVPPAEGTGTVGVPVTAETLSQTSWAWTSLAETAPAAQSVVPTPEKYTIFFEEDGTVNINADCNVVGGTYVIRNNGTLVIELGPSTMAFCGEESLDQQFLLLLGQVASGRFVGENLTLVTDAAATMQLTPVQEIALSPDDISLDIGSLPYTWQAAVVHGTPYDESQPPGPQGLPAHIQVTFAPTDDAAAQAIAPVMYVIPVEVYRSLWDEAGNNAVSESIAQIFQFATALPYPGPSSGIPVLPFEQVTGANDLAVQLGRVPAVAESATQDGYRFVGRFIQDANPVTNQGLQYIYQGFTGDAQYLAAFFAPVRTDALADSVETLAQDDVNRFNSDAAAHMQERAAALSGLESAAWQPDLATLDALVASLTINGMASNAAIGRVWNAVAGNSAPGGEQTPIAEPAKYSLALHPDGRYDYVADCNSGSSSYTITGAMSGSVDFGAGPSTLAACGPESAFDLFMNTLASTQDYRVHPGGELLELVRPAGGGSLFLVNGGPVDPVSPESRPPIEFPTPAPSMPAGTVIAPDGVNIRSGPGTNYPIIGFAPNGTTGTLIGRSNDDQWWAAGAPNLPGGVAWVAAAYVQATNADGLPIIQAPAPPAPVVTPTPQPTASPTISLAADSKTIDQGQCTTLRWDVQNVSAVYVYPLGDDYKKYAEAGQSSREVCPSSTTTYEMRVELTNGQLELRQVTIDVNAPSDPLTGTRWTLLAMMVNQVPIPGTTISLDFGDKGNVTGSSGCNNYSGIYTQSGRTLVIGGITLTQKLCEEDVDQQEQLYVDTLQRTSSYELSGSQLILFDATGQEILRYNSDGRDE